MNFIRISSQKNTIGKVVSWQTNLAYDGFETRHQGNGIYINWLTYLPLDHCEAFRKVDNSGKLRQKPLEVGGGSKKVTRSLRV